MLSTYKLNTQDINPFIAALQSAYPNQEVEITVQEVSPEEPFDETSYLFSNPANKDHLLQVVEDIRNGKNLVPFSLMDETREAERQLPIFEAFFAGLNEITDELPIEFDMIIAGGLNLEASTLS